MLHAIAVSPVSVLSVTQVVGGPTLHRPERVANIPRPDIRPSNPRVPNDNHGFEANDIPEEVSTNSSFDCLWLRWHCSRPKFYARCSHCGTWL